MSVCPFDGKEFTPKRPWQRFCSDRCRYRFRWQHFRVVPAQELQQLAELVERLGASATSPGVRVGAGATLGEKAHLSEIS